MQNCKIWVSLFDISNLEKRLQELEEQTSKQEFWEDTENTKKVLSEIKKIKSKVIKYRELDYISYYRYVDDILMPICIC